MVVLVSSFILSIVYLLYRFISAVAHKASDDDDDNENSHLKTIETFFELSTATQTFYRRTKKNMEKNKPCLRWRVKSESVKVE